MIPILKRQILRLIEAAGYVVIKVADQHRREQRTSELEVELTRRTERIARLETELDRHRDRLLQLCLGRERDASELEAARAETWQLRLLAVELKHQADGHHRSESNTPIS